MDLMTHPISSIFAKLQLFGIWVDLGGGARIDTVIVCNWQDVAQFAATLD